MKLYADRPARLARQVVGDVLLVVLIWLFVRAGRATHEHVDALAGPGRDAEAAGVRFSDNMRTAAGKLGGVPFVGDSVSKPFRDAATSGQDLADAARSFQATVGQVATVLGLVVALVPIVLVVALWVPRRVAWVVEASAATRLAQAGRQATDLLALRALATQPLPRLARLSPTVAQAWRAGDPAAIDALATLELDSLGLRHRP